MDGNFVDNKLDDIIISANKIKELNADPQLQSSEFSTLGSDNQYLKLKFNTPLDPNTVNSENTVVMCQNKIVKCRVYYDSKKKSIIIKPKKEYIKNELYILKVSAKILSSRGRSLRKNLYFAFKYDGTEIKFYNEFRVDRAKPPNKLFEPKDNKLAVLFMFATFVILASYFLMFNPGLIAGTTLVGIAILMGFLENVSLVGRSNKEYKHGAKLYNTGSYEDALSSFEMALHFDPSNNFAKVGLEAAITKCQLTTD